MEHLLKKNSVLPGGMKWKRGARKKIRKFKVLNTFATKFISKEESNGLV